MDFSYPRLANCLRLMNPFLAVEVRVVIIDVIVGNEVSRVYECGWVKRERILESGCENIPIGTIRINSFATPKYSYGRWKFSDCGILLAIFRAFLAVDDD